MLEKQERRCLFLGNQIIIYIRPHPLEILILTLTNIYSYRFSEQTQ